MNSSSRSWWPFLCRHAVEFSNNCKTHFVWSLSTPKPKPRLTASELQTHHTWLSNSSAYYSLATLSFHQISPFWKLVAVSQLEDQVDRRLLCTVRLLIHANYFNGVPFGLASPPSTSRSRTREVDHFKGRINHTWSLKAMKQEPTIEKYRLALYLLVQLQALPVL